VFEIVPNITDNPESSQGSLGGGGRYDGLLEMIGGRPTPACGVALGVERIVTRMREADPELGANNKTRDVFVAQLGEAGRKKAFALFEEIRAAGIRVGDSMSKDAIKAQMEMANKMGAKWAVIVGQKEVLDGTAIIRDMDAGTQETVDARKVVQELQRKLGKN